jgi:branched-subunit amino acid aminotransferase/4-amino-4-deoxychorismate lyase
MTPEEEGENIPIEKAFITLEDLSEMTGVVMVNSLRGAVPCEGVLMPDGILKHFPTSHALSQDLNPILND